MQDGVVKWFNPQRGYGFITRDGEKDLFVHYSEVKGGRLSEGDKVKYEVGEGRKGPCAVNVRLASEEAE